jgi:hypothetical protein
MTSPNMYKIISKTLLQSRGVLFFMYITWLSFGKGTLVILWNEHSYNFYVLSNEGYEKLRDNFVKVK